MNGCPVFRNQAARVENLFCVRQVPNKEVSRCLPISLLETHPDLPALGQRSPIRAPCRARALFSRQLLSIRTRISRCTRYILSRAIPCSRSPVKTLTTCTRLANQVHWNIGCYANGIIYLFVLWCAPLRDLHPRYYRRKFRPLNRRGRAK